jgi:outer membrane receptor for ferrienterochelin and colicins
VNIFTEDHAALSGSRKIVITEELKPERSWNGNVNYSNMVVFNKGFINFDGGVFYTVFSNKIVADYFVNPNAIYYENLRGYGISRGVSANVEFSHTSGLKARIGATFMEVYQMEENSQGGLKKIPQVHAPKMQGVFSVSYIIKPLKLLIDYSGQVFSPMYLPVLPNDYRPLQSPWFTLQNLQVSRKFAKGRIELYAGCKNLFNFMPKDRLMRPFEPFDKQVQFDSSGNAVASANNPQGYTFDTTYGYASMQGRRYYAGIRYELPR